MSSGGTASDAQAELLRLGSQLTQVATARKQDHANLEQLEAWMAHLRVASDPVHIGASVTSGSEKAVGGSEHAGSGDDSTTTAVSDVRTMLQRNLHSAGRDEAHELATGLGRLVAQLLFRCMDRASELLQRLDPADASKKKHAQREVHGASGAVEEALHQATSRWEAVEEGIVWYGGGSGGGGGRGDGLGGNEASQNAAMKQALDAVMDIVQGVHRMAEIRAQALTRVLVENKDDEDL